MPSRIRSSENASRLGRRHDADVEAGGVVLLQILVHLGDQLGIVRAVLVEPEHGRRAGRAGASSPRASPSPESAASFVWQRARCRLPRPCAQQRLARMASTTRIVPLPGDLEGLVVRAVFLGRLRHQADVGHAAHRARIERAVFLAEFDDRLIDAGA